MTLRQGVADNQGVYQKRSVQAWLSRRVVGIRAFRIRVCDIWVLAGLTGLVLSSGTANAGAWLMEQGRGQIIFSSSLTDAPRRFDSKGKPRRSDGFVKQEGFTSVEYGLHERITLLGGLGTQRALFAVAGGPAQGELAQGELAQVDTYAGTAGLRARLWRGSGTILSTQFTFTGRTERATLIINRMEPRLEADLRVLVGHGLEFGRMSAFGELQAGYRWRADGHSDELRLDATLGIRPVPFVLLMLQSLNTLALSRDRLSGAPAARQHKLQFSAVADITEQLSVQISVFGSVRGRETLQERGAMLAVWRKF